MKKNAQNTECLVDLMRNDISAVSEVGSVQVERFDVEAYAQVQHLVSHLSGVLNARFDRAGCVAGSLSLVEV